MRSKRTRQFYVIIGRLEQGAIPALSIVLLCLVATSMALFLSNGKGATVHTTQYGGIDTPSTLIWRVTPERIVSLESGATFPLRWENNAEWRVELATAPREVLLLASPGASTITERLRRELHTAGIAARVRHVGTSPPPDLRRAVPHHSNHWDR